MECHRCHGRIVFGELYPMKWTTGGKTEVEWYCRECGDEVARDFWLEDYGPCPYLPMHAAGHG